MAVFTLQQQSWVVWQTRRCRAWIFTIWPFILGLFRTAPMTYGNSQARGWIGAVATSLHHRSEQCWILNPLIEARDGTCILTDTSQIRFCWATVRTPYLVFTEVCQPLQLAGQGESGDHWSGVLKVGCGPSVLRPLRYDLWPRSTDPVWGAWQVKNIWTHLINDNRSFNT